MDAFRFDPDKHRYYFGDTRVTGITEALGRTGITPPIPAGALKNFEYAGERGGVVHKMCELYDLGSISDFDLDPAMEPYLDAWVSFRKKYQYEPSLVETPLGHPLYRYGGIPDSAGLYEEGGMVAERKTCELTDQIGFQLALQELLVEKALGFSKPRLVAVRLKADGSFEARDYTAERRRYQSLGLAAVAIANYQIGRER
jgi:hypothetical protein